MLRDKQQRVESRNRLTALQESHLRAVQTALGGKVFLRESLLLAAITNAFAERKQKLLDGMHLFASCFLFAHSAQRLAFRSAPCQRGIVGSLERGCAPAWLRSLDRFPPQRQEPFSSVRGRVPPRPCRGSTTKWPRTSVPF